MTAYFEVITPERFACGWTENGMNYRSNTVNGVGAVIPLHAHSYDHHARVKGSFDVTVIMPNGQKEEFRLEDGAITFIPKRFRHSFKSVELMNGVGEVLCYWPVGSDA